MAEPATTTPPISNKKTYTCSCHCGTFKGTVAFSLPPQIPPKGATSTVRFRRGNCSTCHKTGIFNIRFPDPPSEFKLLSPIITSDRSTTETTSGNSSADEKTRSKGEGNFGGIDTGEGRGKLGCYTAVDHILNFFFCNTCGVHCFILTGEGELVEDEELGRKVWRIKRVQAGGEFKESVDDYTGYFALNGRTLDQGQEGANLAEWKDNEWVSYLDCKEYEGEERYSRPHPWGAY
jgi:hypothetical protein